MANNIKSETLAMPNSQLNVEKVGLGVSTSEGTPTVTLVGTVAAAGTGAGSAGASGGAVATHVFTVEVSGTTYYIPMCNTNAS